jgi:hypothetical protein
MNPEMMEDEDDPALEGEASKMAMADIMALLQRARGARLRSKMPKPAEAAPGVAGAPDDNDQDALAQLAAMLGAEDPDKAAC